MSPIIHAPAIRLGEKWWPTQLEIENFPENYSMVTALLQSAAK
jgi:hypothetical protein